MISRRDVQNETRLLYDIIRERRGLVGTDMQGWSDSRGGGGKGPEGGGD